MKAQQIECESSIKQFETQHERIKMQHNMETQRRGEAKAKLKELKKEIDMAEEYMKKIEKEESDLSAKWKKAEEEYTEKNKERAALYSKHEVDNKFNSVEERNWALRQEVDALQSTIERAEGSLDLAKNEVANFEKNVEELQEQLDNVEDAPQTFDEAAHKKKALKNTEELNAKLQESRSLQMIATQANRSKEDAKRYAQTHADVVRKYQYRYSNAITFVEQQFIKGEGADGAKEYYGTVAWNITVKPAYHVAVESALGASMSRMLVRDVIIQLYFIIICTLSV